ncbi:MAG: rhodanese-like domain-containing protein [Burkholderiaceae bacterium]|nr:rhodanese-like domain-containing protein [Burkholderiaceae bacterium]
MIFIQNNILLFVLALVSGGMLLWPLLQKRGSKVSILQATQLFNQGKTLFLDVRDEAEFATGHVREARNIPLKQLTDKVGELAKFKAKTVIVMCATGVRASKAAAQLKAAGFETVHILEGGVTAWQSQGMPLVK